jgi:hypothetical protein
MSFYKLPVGLLRTLVYFRFFPGVSSRFSSARSWRLLLPDFLVVVVLVVGWSDDGGGGGMCVVAVVLFPVVVDGGKNVGAKWDDVAVEVLAAANKN